MSRILMLLLPPTHRICHQGRPKGEPRSSDGQVRFGNAAENDPNRTSLKRGPLHIGFRRKSHQIGYKGVEFQLSKINQWPLRRRAVFVTATAFVGTVIGFASSGDYARLSPNILVAIPTCMFAIANLMFLESRPSNDDPVGSRSTKIKSMGRVI
jgi:hypothetical protein